MAADRSAAGPEASRPRARRQRSLRWPARASPVPAAPPGAAASGSGPLSAPTRSPIARHRIATPFMRVQSCRVSRRAQLDHADTAPVAAQLHTRRQHHLGRLLLHQAGGDQRSGGSLLAPPALISRPVPITVVRAAFARFGRERIDALAVATTPGTYRLGPEIRQGALSLRMPVVGYVEQDAVAEYTPIIRTSFASRPTSSTPSAVAPTRLSCGSARRRASC